MQKKINVRKAKAADQRNLINLLNDTDYYSWNDSLGDYLKDQNYKIYQLENNLETIGLIISRVIFDEAEIYLVFIKKDLRSRGLGSFLLEKVIESLKQNGIRRVILEVSSNNKIALALYNSIGFKRNRIRKNYYKEYDGYELILEF